MRIPTLEGPKVAATEKPRQYGNANFDVGAEGVKRAAAGLGQSVDTAIKAQRAMEAQAKREAQAVSLANADAEFTKSGTFAFHGSTTKDPKWGIDATKPEPLLSKRGQDAVAQSGETLSWLEKERERIAKGITDEEARGEFLNRSVRSLEGYRAKAEGYTAQEIERSKVDAVKNTAASALDAIAADHDDPEAVAQHMQSVETAIRNVGGPKEEQDVKIRAVYQEATKARLNQFLSKNDWEGAENLFEQTKQDLGPGADKFAKVISTMKEDQQAERIAQALVEESRDPESGVADEEWALSGVDEKVAEGPLRDEVKKRIGPRLAQEQENYRREIKKTYGRALGAFLENGEDIRAIDSEDKAYLLEHDSEKWAALVDRSNAAARRKRGGRKGSGGSKDSAAQVKAFVALQAEMASDPEKFAAQSDEDFAHEYFDRLGPSLYKQAGGRFAALKKEDPIKAGEFSRFINDEVNGNEALKRKGTADQFRAFMGDQRRAFLEKNKREPNYDDMEAMRQAAWKTTVEKGWLYDSETPAFKAKRAAPKPAPQARPPNTAAPTSLERPTKGERVKQLKANGLTQADALKILRSEGY
jgi:hypothetical protein